MRGKFFVILAAFAVAFSFSGCVKGKSDADFIKETRKVIKEKANDPDSVKFHEDFIVNRTFAREKDASGNPMIIPVCGKANAKNLFGAYTGYKRFIIFYEPDNNGSYKIQKIKDGSRYFILHEDNYVNNSSKYSNIELFDMEWKMFCTEKTGGE